MDTVAGNEEEDPCWLDEIPSISRIYVTAGTHFMVTPHLERVQTMSALGVHTLADYWRCQELSSAEWLDLIREAVDAAGATLVSLRSKDFEPHGFTAFALLSESHLAVHTWPERDYVAIDLFTWWRR